MKVGGLEVETTISVPVYVCISEITVRGGLSVADEIT